MLVAWLDFCGDERIGPDAVEQALFRRMHAPQYYLAGLPVAFLGPSQLRFIAEPLLLDVWSPTKILRRDAYLPLADLLSCYAFLSSQRRAADREEKEAAENAMKAIHQESSDELVAPEESELDAIEAFPMLSSHNCPTCGRRLQCEKALQVPKDGIIAVRFYCARCDNYQSNRVSLEWLKSLGVSAR